MTYDLTFGGFVTTSLNFAIVWLAAFGVCMVFLVAYEDGLKRLTQRNDHAKTGVMVKCAVVGGLLLAVIWMVKSGF